MLKTASLNISIAVICKNEAQNISRCLDSILACIQNSTLTIKYDVLLVDSFSTDSTIAIATQYPIRILQLYRDWFHSPSAGRFTAVNNCTSDWILFIDADMELEHGFIEKALKFVSSTPNTAAVTGIIQHASLGTTYSPIFNIDRGEIVPVFPPLNKYKPTKIKSVPGLGLFNMSIIRKAGNFNPHLSAEEEYDLCQRIRRGGYDLYYLPVLCGVHYGYFSEPIKELQRRIRSGFMRGIGDMFRQSVRGGFAQENFLRFRTHILLYSFLIMSLPGLTLLPISMFLQIWLSGFTAIFVCMLMRKRSLSATCAAIFTRIVIGHFIFTRFFSKCQLPEEYPCNPRIIK